MDPEQTVLDDPAASEDAGFAPDTDLEGSVLGESDAEGAADGGEADQTGSDGSDDQPDDWEARFKGLQKTVQQQTERLQQYEQARQQASQEPQFMPQELTAAQQIQQAEMLLADRMRLGAISQQDANLANQYLTVAKQQLATQIRERFGQEQLARERATLQPYAKTGVIERLEQELKIPANQRAAFRAYVQPYNDPRDVDAHARAFAHTLQQRRDARKVDQLQQQAQNERTLAPTGRSARAGGQSREQILQRYQGGDPAQAIKALRKAGLYR